MKSFTVSFSLENIQKLYPEWEEEQCLEALSIVQKPITDYLQKEGLELIEDLLREHYGPNEETHKKNVEINKQYKKIYEQQEIFDKANPENIVVWALSPGCEADGLAIEGECRLYCNSCTGAGEYLSDPLDSPTWGVLAAECDNMLKVTSDQHHIYFEGIKKNDKLTEKYNIQIYEFVMSS